MTSREQLSDFVSRRISIGRVQPGTDYRYYPRSYLARQQLPSKEGVAQSLLADAEFRSLRLGNWLNSPSGELVAEAVAYVVPTALQPEFGLIVDGLKLAADLQQARGRKQIGAVSVGLVLVGIVARESLSS